MFSLGIEFLTGSAVMTATATREEAEWPPHPARVFMALVAAHYETRPLSEDGTEAMDAWEAERRALEWLEKQDSPALACMKDVARLRRAVVKQYVPVNDASLPRNPTTVKKEDLRDALGVMPALRSRQERTFPSVGIGFDAPERLVYLIWKDVALPSELAAPLTQLTAKVIRIGHSSSLVQVWLANDAPEPTLVPQLTTFRSGSSVSLRKVAPGLLADLDQRFNAEEISRFFDLAAGIESTSGKAQKEAKALFKEQFGEDYRASLAHPVRLRPVVGVSQSYQANLPQDEPMNGTVFDSELLILTKDEGIVLGLESTNQLLEALRGTLLSGSEDAPEWFTGHHAPGQPATRPHLALLPLPYVGTEHADGHLLGLALAFPKDISPEDRAAQLRRIFFDASGRPKPITLKLGRGLDNWVLSREDRAAPPLALRSQTWTGPSSVWASVTPVVLDHHPKHDPASAKGSEREAWRQEVAESVIGSCERIGLPAPIRIDIDKTSWHRGAPRAKPGPGGMPWLSSKTGHSKQQVHVLLEFGCEVQGPVLLGAGRYRGYGLCKPLGYPRK
ncbi:MAG: type I-U CRISPR-associated protein Cas5/Cas6 [Verrucomicrobiaceae bacterium]|nr:type I-U CRISPR-associated protein Cas5/Cas6 [Verrucomicrobiaceae bacterium]